MNDPGKSPNVSGGNGLGLISSGRGHAAFRGEIVRVVLGTLRTAGKPLDTQAITLFVMAARGLERPARGDPPWPRRGGRAHHRGGWSRFTPPGPPSSPG